METMSLAETFQQYFSIDMATTHQQKEDVFGLRYRVYCDEFKFESPDNFPEKLEFDEYDAQSRHCLITHKLSGRPAGCVRLVPTYSNEVRDPLPFEKHCADSLDEEFIRSLNVGRRTMCEISRLAVDAGFRKRVGEAKTRCGEVAYVNSDEAEQRTFPLIAVSAFLASTALTNSSFGVQIGKIPPIRIAASHIPAVA